MGYASVNASHSRYKADFEDGKKIKLNVTTVKYYNQHTFALVKVTQQKPVAGSTRNQSGEELLNPVYMVGRCRHTKNFVCQ